MVRESGAQGEITDAELCKAIAEVRLGQADDLGGGVFKKRLGKNRQRSIILAKGRHYWVYAYLYAKKWRDNISDVEPDGFRRLAKVYDRKSDTEIEIELQGRELVELSDDNQS